MFAGAQHAFWHRILDVDNMAQAPPTRVSLNYCRSREYFLSCRADGVTNLEARQEWLNMLSKDQDVWKRRHLDFLVQFHAHRAAAFAEAQTAETKLGRLPNPNLLDNDRRASGLLCGADNSPTQATPVWSLCTSKHEFIELPQH